MAGKKKPVKTVAKATAKKAAGKRDAPRKAAPRNAAQPVPKTEGKKEAAFPVVGIGASAGGLEAFEAFFSEMPPDSGMAFVLVAHLDPTHVSLLPELLQKRTRMTVYQAQDGMKVRPNAVYVIPPNKNLSILHGSLQLMELTQPRGSVLPIDSFLRSLAQDRGRHAICIILSGTGTDGTLGVKAIKGEVGMVMVQDEESAKYDGMPRSAIATGLADYVLPPGKMPEQLMKYAERLDRKDLPAISPADGKTPDALQKVFVVLRSRTGHDFSLYKKNTIRRRIERRMTVHQIENINDYVRYLQGSDREANVLFKELLIGVTNFFRDPEAFETLKTKALLKILQGKPDDSPVRVWSPGCSSGEEAYSVAIVLHECMEDLKRHFNIQVFGTDIDEDAIDAARKGLYPASISPDVGADRLKRCFTKEDDGHYRIKKAIREMLVFAPQNAIEDPPFTKLDLICCRNLLIYLGPELQQKLLPLFHYSLKPDGLLFLGSSETIGQHTHLFSMFDKKWKIFRKKPSTLTDHAALSFPSLPKIPEALHSSVPDTIGKAEKLSVLQLVETILQQSDAPPCAIVDDACNIVYVHGRTGRFLEPAEGKASVNIVEMARPGLKLEMEAAIRKAGLDKQEVVRRGVRVQHNGGHLLVDLVVKPILERTAMRGLMMVVFQETPPSGKAEKGEPRTPRGKKRGRTVEELAEELQYTKENLQTTIEELETSNEELKSTNEELQSTNEELQSTNEEMETSKEELQSLNEESATVNAELQARIDELAKANDDLKNLLDSTEIAIVFLDGDLCIRRFTPTVTEIIPLAGTDSGRPIKHFASNLVDVNLTDCAEQVLGDLAVRESEVETEDGKFFLMRVRPYRTVANVIDGVVITFQDITERKETQKEKRLAVVVRDSNDAITLQDREGWILEWNAGAERMYGYTKEEALKLNIADIVPTNRRQEAIELVKTLFQGKVVESLETRRVTKDGRVLDVWLTITVVKDANGNPEYIATTERNITGRGKG